MPCINSSGSWQCTSVGDIFWSDLRPLWTTLPLFKPRSLPMSNMCSCFSLCASCCRYFLTYSCSFSWFFPLVLLCLFLWEYFFLLDNGLQCNNIRLRSLFSSENSWLLTTLLARTVEIPVEILREKYRECRGGQKKKQRDDSREYWRKHKL